jgi:heme-degrading monooxygenase HmoA
MATPYVIKRVTTRTNPAVPFALGAPRLRASKAFQRFFQLRKNAAGFLGQTRTISADKLTATTIITWESVDAARAFVKAHPRLVHRLKSMMRRHNARAGHKSKASLVTPGA